MTKTETTLTLEALPELAALGRIGQPFVYRHTRPDGGSIEIEGPSGPPHTLAGFIAEAMRGLAAGFEAFDADRAAAPAKRGPGRPPGSSSKRGPGRPKGSKTKRGPGRPKGSKSKTKRGPGRPRKAKSKRSTAQRTADAARARKRRAAAKAAKPTKKRASKAKSKKKTSTKAKASPPAADSSS